MADVDENAWAAQLVSCPMTPYHRGDNASSVSHEVSPRSLLSFLFLCSAPSSEIQKAHIKGLF